MRNADWRLAIGNTSTFPATQTSLALDGHVQRTRGMGLCWTATSSTTSGFFVTADEAVRRWIWTRVATDVAVRREYPERLAASAVPQIAAEGRARSTKQTSHLAGVLRR